MRRAGQWVVVAFGVFTALECYAPDGNIANSELKSWGLRQVFAMPSKEFAETVVTEGEPGAWATMPPRFYDTPGVFAQTFHCNPIFGGCWMSRWSDKQEEAYRQYFAVFQASRQDQDPSQLAAWLKEQGVKNVLLTCSEPGEEVSEQYITRLAKMINVVDARETFRPELDPFANATRRLAASTS